MGTVALAPDVAIGVRRAAQPQPAQPFISVVVPLKSPTPFLRDIRQQLAQTATPVETIFVIGDDLRGQFRREYPHERIVVARRQGRGFACVDGADAARGQIVLFLHADTILPPDWDCLVGEALQDEGVIGGAFSLSFDRRNLFLRFLIFLADLLFHLTGELWGDRAIFVRSEHLKACLPSMDVLIMEDVRLSHCLRGRGKVVLLKEKVTTSASRFFKRGLLDHTLRILRCRLLYALGSDLERIWRCYYREAA